MSNLENVRVGDELTCLVMQRGNIVPVKHTVTRIEGLDWYGIRHDTEQEVAILGASII